MKKTYIAPELGIQLIQLEGLIALSKYEDPATGDDALIKEDRGEDIWGSSKNVWDDDWSK